MLSYPVRNKSQIPSELFLIPDEKCVYAFAFKSHRGTRQLLWTDHALCSGSHATEAFLAQLIEKHSIPAGVPVALVAPGGIGGFLLIANTSRRNGSVQHAVSRMEHDLPFSIDDLQWRVHCAGGLLEVFWVMKSWVENQRAMLDRLGLNLEEIYPRASLFRHLAENPGCERLIVREQSKNGIFSHEFEQAVVARSLSLSVVVSELDDGVQNSPRDPAPLQVINVDFDALDPNLPSRLGALRQGASEAIQVDQSARTILRPALRIGSVVAIVGLIGAVFMDNRASSLEQSMRAAETELKKLRSSATEYDAARNSIRTHQLYLDALAKKSAPDPLPSISTIVKFMPAGAWITRINFDEKALEIRGSGTNGEAIISATKEANLSGPMKNLFTEPRSNEFALSVDFTKPIKGASK